MKLPAGVGLGRRFALIGVAAAAATTAVVAASGAASAAEQPEAPLVDVGTSNAVPGSYVVTLKSSRMQASAVDASADSLARQYGGRATYKYHRAVRGFAVDGLSATQARQLAANPAVASVQANVRYTISDTQSGATWGLDRVDQRDLPLDQKYTYPTTASNVHAYVIDTGIRYTHSQFGGRATFGTDTLGDGRNGVDCQGHGTHVAGTIGGKDYGLAKGVQLVGVRVLNCQGSGDTAGVAAGIDWVTQHAIKPAVANMSLGGSADATLDAAVKNSIASGVTYGIAAGNDNGGNACNTSPARVPEAITVGATTNTDARAGFSNIGTCLDIFAPGNNITSAWGVGNDNSTSTISGTSMATPHVVGAAALVAAANPGWTPQQVRDALVDNATNGKVTNPGSGSPNKLLFVVQNGGTPPADDFSVAVTPAAGSVEAGKATTATVSTKVASGTPGPVALSVSGAPTGVSATVSPSSVAAGGSATLNITTLASAPAGTYTLTVTATTDKATHTATYALTVTGGGPNPGGCTGTNAADVQIPDAGIFGPGKAANSPIAISGCARNASATSKVEVHIVHTYRGDLRVDLVAPDGSVYNLKAQNTGGSADNIDDTYTANAAGEAANGTWNLRVTDYGRVDTGYINSWTLTV